MDLMDTKRPTLYIIAGPNGAGKTTFAFKRLKAISGSVHFINMDEIARGLSPLQPSAAERSAAQIALNRFKHFVNLETSFSIETTLSGRSYLEFIKTAIAKNYIVEMLYFYIETPEICIERIKQRVIEGGHDVSNALVYRRYQRSLNNIQAYAQLCDAWRIYNASNYALKLMMQGTKHDFASLDTIVSLLPENITNDICNS